MERLSDRAIEIINELHTERLDHNSEYLPLIDAAQKLNDIETVMGDYDLDRLRELVQADREGRCAILSEPMKPMVYKPNDTDVYCPNCGETLSGGWPLVDWEDSRRMYQCPYCGQSIDTYVCEPYKSALKARKRVENDG